MPESLGALIVSGEIVRAQRKFAAQSEQGNEPLPVAPQDWELAVGTKIARRARPTKLARGVLHVRTASSTWAQELSLLADTIVAQLRARGVDVRSMRFHVGAVEPMARPSWRTDVRTSPEPVKLPPIVKTSLAKVEDVDLRTAIAKAAAASLAYEAGEAARAAARRPTSPRSGAPAPRSAAPRSAPQDRTTAERRAAPRGTRGGPSHRGS